MTKVTNPAPEAELPLGYKASEEDWNEAFAGRPMKIADWKELTMGEQRRYAAIECKTKGALYSSRITEDTVSFTVKLPESLRLSNLTREEAVGYERQLHRVVEDRIASIIQYRQMVATAERKVLANG